MADLIADGLSWLDSQRHQHLTRSVVYRRGASEVTVSATVGRTEFEEFGADGSVIRSESRDYIIRVADLGDTIAQGFRPERGDLIIEAIGDEDVAYEVMSITSGDEPWRFHDRRQSQYRITTKAVGREAS